jgi:hypothetical protein
MVPMDCLEAQRMSGRITVAANRPKSRLIYIKNFALQLS